MPNYNSNEKCINHKSEICNKGNQICRQSLVRHRVFFVVRLLVTPWLYDTSRGSCRRRVLWGLRLLDRVLPCHIMLPPRGPPRKYQNTPSTYHCTPITFEVDRSFLLNNISTPSSLIDFGFNLLGFQPIYILCLPSFSRSLPFATQIRGHNSGSSPRPPHYCACLCFYRERSSAFSSLADSRRIVRAYARSFLRSSFCTSKTNPPRGLSKSRNRP